MNRYCILFFLAGLISCTKYLDKKPDSSLTVPTSLNDLQALLDYSFVINQTQSPSFGETSSDDYFMPDEMLFTFPQEYQGIYYWQRGDYGIGNDWSHCYFVVYYANFCLEGLQPLDPKLNPDSWNRVKGSALFLRSYNFLNLL